MNQFVVWALKTSENEKYPQSFPTAHDDDDTKFACFVRQQSETQRF